MARRKRSKPSSVVFERGELGATLSHTRKQYGVSSVNTASAIPQPERISTGAFILDFATLGGFPVSRASMIVGERHAGKTMLSMKLIANAQEKFPDQTPVFVDIEQTFDATWAKKLGVNIDDLPVVNCETGEMAVDVVEAVIQSAETSLVIIDSIAALTPFKEIDDSASDQHVGIQARLVARMVRKATAAITRERMRNHDVSVLFINQFRSKIGVSFGDPRSIPGGKALEYCTTLQVIMKNKENKGKDALAIDTVETNEHAFTITKNKMNNGPRSGEFILIRHGEREGQIDDGATMLAYAKKFGIYTGGGSRWTLDIDGDRKSFGKAQEAVDALTEDAQLYWDLRCHLLRLQAVNLNMSQEFIETIG